MFGKARLHTEGLSAKKLAACLLSLVLCLGLFACGGSSNAGADEDKTSQADSNASQDNGQENNTAEQTSERTIVDLAGRDVTVPANIQRATAIAGPSYEKIFMLGQADRLIGIHFYMIDRPWVVATNPTVSDLTPIESPGEPNVEGLVALDTDAVFFFDYSEPLAAMEQAGLNVVVVQNSSGNPTTADEFVAYQKREVNVFAQAFGDEAIARAAEWTAYFDDRVAYVQERVGSIPAEERKTAVYAYGEEGLGLFSAYSYPSFWLELAGGRNIADETGAEMDTVVTMEQIVAWDPDYIFTGRMDSTDTITDNPAWAELSAVQNGNVVICPDGVMYWDYSSEGVLLMQYLAKTMYPELFADLDMVAEVQYYYQTFYGYELSASDAQRILDHLPPA